MRALRIDPAATVTDLDLPEPNMHSAILEHVGSPEAVDQGVCHPRAALHIHGSGRATGLTQNLAARTLASASRGTALHPLDGSAVITGRTSTGGVAALDDELTQHTYTVAQTVRDTFDAWRAPPPVSNDAAIGELLTYASRDISSLPGPVQCGAVTQANQPADRGRCHRQ